MSDRSKKVSLKTRNKTTHLASGWLWIWVLIPSTTQKMMFPADLVTFTEESLNGKLYFFVKCICCHSDPSELIVLAQRCGIGKCDQTGNGVSTSGRSNQIKWAGT